MWCRQVGSILWTDQSVRQAPQHNRTTDARFVPTTEPRLASDEHRTTIRCMRPRVTIPPATPHWTGERDRRAADAPAEVRSGAQDGGSADEGGGSHAFHLQGVPRVLERCVERPTSSEKERISPCTCGSRSSTTPFSTNGCVLTAIRSRVSATASPWTSDGNSSSNLECYATAIEFIASADKSATLVELGKRRTSARNVDSRPTCTSGM